MRTITLSGGTATVPNERVYAFNPSYVELNMAGTSGVIKLAVTDGTHTYDIDVTLYNGYAQCYVARLFQLLFDDYVNTRHKRVTMTFSDADGNSLGSTTFLVLWAALEAGMTYGYYLPIVSDVYGAGREKREVVWFKNLPQQVSYFNGSAIVEVAPASLNVSGITLIPNTDKVGTYLRWIDSYGFWQYYLFDTGEKKSKNSLSKTVIDADYMVGEVLHTAQRSIHVENTDTIKCCATNLKKEVLAYVETIYKSPHIELYVGDGIWKPVSIAAGTVTVENTRRLFDYEISITLPDTQVQTI